VAAQCDGNEGRKVIYFFAGIKIKFMLAVFSIEICFYDFNM
jgi:hypothetical protein